MKRQSIIVLLAVAFLLTACAPPAAPALSNPEAVPDMPAVEAEEAAEIAPELVSTDCLNGEISPVGQSIAADYDHISYEQIITWFCNGAEFEDILTALETETLVEASAEEMLLMLANGSSWNEIWQQLGLTD